jgi:hypothetical protein
MTQACKGKRAYLGAAKDAAALFAFVLIHVHRPAGAIVRAGGRVSWLAADFPAELLAWGKLAENLHRRAWR